MNQYYQGFFLYMFNQVTANGSGNLETTTFSVSVIFSIYDISFRLYNNNNNDSNNQYFYLCS